MELREAVALCGTIASCVCHLLSRCCYDILDSVAKYLLAQETLFQGLRRACVRPNGERCGDTIGVPACRRIIAPIELGGERKTISTSDQKTLSSYQTSSRKPCAS
jgi:hypothetical protein